MEGGYNFKTTEPVIPKEYVCLICQLLLKEPTELPCSHVYCNHCLIKWEDQKIEENEKSKKPEENQLRCLLCNEPYLRDQKHPSRAFDRMIRTSLDILCKQHQLGCKWVGKIVDFKEHERVCNYVEVNCPVEGCDINIQRQHLMKHEEECPNQIVGCILCGELLKFLNIERHIKEHCPNFKVECPNSGCNHKVERHLIKEHLENDCLYQKVNCQFHLIGCDATLLRKDIEKHNTTFNSQHTDLLLHKYLATNNALIKNKEELEKTKQTVLKINNELHATNQERFKTKEELSETKLMISKINDELRETKLELFRAKEELNGTMKNVNASKKNTKTATNNKFKSIRETIKAQNEQLKKNIAEIKELDVRIAKQFQTSFRVIEKSTKIIAENFAPNETEPTFENLLPLLNENNYQQHMDLLYMPTIKMDEQIYEFSELNKTLKPPLPSYEERLEIVLKSMKTGEIYSMNERKHYFKLQFNNHCDVFYVWNSDVKTLQQACATALEFGNDMFALFNAGNEYQLHYEAEGSFDTKSSMYIYNNTKADQKLLIKYRQSYKNIDFTQYKSKSNEILFQVVKK